MILIVNGAFGAGKTTLAKNLAAMIEGAVIYDPERWGYVLQRVPPWTLGQFNSVEDFQELGLWGTLIKLGIKRAARKAKIVIVPMAFSNARRLDDLRNALRDEAEVRTICLVAPIDVIGLRLARRAEAAGRPVTEFEHRRSKECAVAHADPVFGIEVDATKPPEHIAAEIVASLGLREVST